MILTPTFEVHIQAWAQDESLDWHDHRGSSGAVTAVSGSLVEHAPAKNYVDVVRRCKAGTSSTIGPDHVHDVLFVAGAPAVSMRAYPPPLWGLTFCDCSEVGFAARKYVEEER